MNVTKFKVLAYPLNYDIRERLINKHSASRPNDKSTNKLTN